MKTETFSPKIGTYRELFHHIELYMGIELINARRALV